MILQELTLDPFAAFTARRSIAFREGLNVVLGPNEAGKSTLVKALRLALFVPCNLRKPEFERTVREVLPLTGGDLVRVELDFALDGQAYRLSKSWGSKRESVLRLPAGGTLADPAAVETQLARLLGPNQATYERVLISYQSQLGATLEDLRESEPVQRLGAILRQAAFDAGGVPVDELGQLIERRCAAHDDHWDVEARRPEGYRTAGGRWKVRVGAILQAFYALEDCRRAVEEARQYEAALDEANDRLRALSEQAAALKARVDRDRPLVQDARERARIEAERARLELEARRLDQALQEWPEAEGELRASRQALDKAKADALRADEELAKAAEMLKDRKRFEQFEVARRKKSALDDAQQRLAALKRVSSADLAGLEALHRQGETLKAQLAAGKLSLSLTTGQPMEVDVQKDLDAPVRFPAVDATHPLEVEAGGQITLRNARADWVLRVRSGEMDFDQLRDRHDKAVRELAARLGELGEPDLETARRDAALYQEQQRALQQCTRDLAEALAGQDYAALEAAVRAMGDLPALLPIDRLASNKARAEAELSRLTDRVAQLNRQIAAWQKEFGTQADARRRMVQNQTALDAKDTALRQLRPLPDGVTDAGSFIRQHDSDTEQLSELRDALREAEGRRAALMARPPARPLEALEDELAAAERAFEQAEREGAALRRVRDVFQSLRAAMDAHTFTPWETHLAALLTELTQQRYRAVPVANGRIGPLLRADGLTPTAEMLSTGTRAGIGLALRLSMAEWFLRDRRGFLVLDDPLVDLDPARKSVAVEAIQRFAREKQVILFTCHPDHAALLGGHRIELGQPPAFRCGD